MSCKVL
ncbi:uncharacterized protein FTOL_12534 [Fusarium torulosum]|nr:uncharacterized protein FTOL_12534 [Fusarium torulosum]